MKRILSLTLISLFLSLSSFAIHAISGTKHVCVGGTTFLFDSSFGGVWTSHNTTIATIGSSTGIVSGVNPGIDTITYYDSGLTVTTTVTVYALPGPISGVNHLCVGAYEYLTDSTTPGGTWSSGSGSISVVGSTTGLIMGASAGTGTVTYTSAGGCTRTFLLTVNPNPAPITGPSTVLTGGNITLSDVTAGGTWSSAFTGVATINSTSGLVTGVAVGVTIITYALPTGCTDTTLVYDSSGTTVSAISGGSTVCVGSTIGLTDSTTGGTWTSSDTAIATVSSSGVVTGISSGTVIITYSVGTSYVIKTITVNTAASITGPGSVCIGSTITLTGTPSGGAWSSGSTAIATVTSGGLVAGVSAGIVNIYYSHAGCYAYHTVTVSAMPTAITGPTTVAAGSNITLSDAVGGGTWSSSNISIATVNPGTGVVTGVSAGTVTITYSTGGSCAVYVTITVTGGTTIAAITGSSSVCVGNTTVLTDATTGGTWSSSSTAIATVGSSTGIVTGVSAGTVTITYTVGAGHVTKTITVFASPAAITGLSTVAVTGTITLADVTGGGGWSSSSTSIATVGSTGIVTGVSAGTCTITYMLTTGCFTTKTITVTGTTTVSSISGSSGVCVGSTITLFDSTSGGTWTSSNTSIATVGSSSGVVTGVAAGTVTITYTVGTSFVTKTITVNPAPSAITGSSTVAVTGTITLADATGGGVWSSSNSSIASVGSLTGVVTGVSAGTCTITYMLTTGCFTTKTITVTGTTTVSSISGSSGVCVGATITLFDSTSGGVWSSSNTSIATVGSSTGVVTGVSAGIATITYTVGSSFVTKTISVNPSPGAITGSSTVSVGSVITLADVTAGGIWSSSSTAIAAVGSLTGIVTGVSAGTCTITYSLPTGCFATKTITVLADSTSILPITGYASVCVGSVMTLTDATPGGTWSSSNTAIATVTTTGGVVTGVSVGTVTITYTVGGSHVTTTITVVTGAAITGPTTVCTGSTVTLSGTPAGGTWASGGLSIATVGSTTGIVTGIGSGIVNIYYSSGSCYAYHTMTVNAAAAITGAGTVCIGGTTALSASLSGGSWSSSNTAIATVSTTGVVSGVSAGTATISYLRGGCYATHTVTVSAGAIISGGTTVCIGSTTSVFASPTGGSWSSSNPAIATISSAGLISGVSAGVVTISYLSGGCYATRTVTVNAAPTISGGSTVCIGSSITLSSTTTGGTWSTADTTIAWVSSTGVVTGLSSGVATIYYTVGGCYATHTVTVNATAVITGGSSVCIGTTTTLTASIPGGSWSSSNTAIATVSTVGVVSGVSAGTVTISYLSGGCYATHTVTVNTSASISGAGTVCTGSSITLTASPAGGSWSSGNTAIATVTSGGVVTGVGAGIVNIYYTDGGCSAYHTVTVNAAPVITGPGTVCVGATITLAGSPAGGSWSSGNTAIATVTTAGVVSGAGSGIVNIYYTVGGCETYHTVTVNTTSATITGSRFVCSGSTTTLSGTPAGGTWTSASTVIATVGSASGIVTGYAAGVTTIYYSEGGCYAYVSETVNPLPEPILGSSYVCIGSAITLTDATSGATWSSSNMAVAIVGSSTGVVIGVSVGVATISFSEGGCLLTKTVSVNAIPPGITGPTSVLVGYGIALSDAAPGGSWLSGNTAIATINPSTGVVIGVSAGTVNMYYTVGGCTVYYTITVSDVPLGPVHGTTSVGSVTLTDGSIKLYPNPTSGKLSIQWENQNNGSADVSVTDVTGREVYKTTMYITDAAGTAQFDLSNLKDGIYLVTIRSENIYYTGKLMINK